MEESQSKRRSGRWRWSARQAQRNASTLVACETGGGRRRNVLYRVFCYVRRLSDAFGTHQCSLMACACAYCALLSFVPLLVVGIAVYGFLMRSPQKALESVLNALRGYAPNVEFIKDVHGILEHIFEDRGLIGLLGLLGLLYTGHQAFLAMQPAMNLIWVVPETRHWFRQRLVAFGAALYTIVLLGADLAFSALIVYIQSVSHWNLPDWLKSLPVRMAVTLLPMLVVTLLFALLYKLLPARHVPTRAAWLGAVVAAPLWQMSKVAFGIFVLHVNSYYRLYGSLGSLVILVVWAYYSMAILLLGAEIAADYESVRHSARAAEARAHSGADLAAAHGTPALAREVVEEATKAPEYSEARPPDGTTG